MEKFLGPDYMEADWPGWKAGSFAAIGIRLVLYSKNFPGQRAYKTECAYVMPMWHVIQKEF